MKKHNFSCRPRPRPPRPARNPALAHHVLRGLAPEVPRPVQHLHHLLQLPAALEVVEQHEGVIGALPQLGEDVLALLGRDPSLLEQPPPIIAPCGGGTTTNTGAHDLNRVATLAASPHPCFPPPGAAAATATSDVAGGVSAGAQAHAEQLSLFGERPLDGGFFLPDMVLQHAVVQGLLDLVSVGAV